MTHAKRLVCMATAGDCPTLDVSAPWAARYAVSIGADFYIRRHENHGGGALQKHNFVKLVLDEMSRHYAQTLWLDADVIVRPGAPDIFGAVPLGALGAWCGEADVWGPDSERPRPRYKHGYFNSGVMVWPAGASGLMHLAVNTWRARASRMSVLERSALFGEQTALNKVVDESGIPVTPIDARFNWYLRPEHAARIGLDVTPETAWCVHFAGGAHTPQIDLERGVEGRWSQRIRADYMAAWVKEQGL